MRVCLLLLLLCVSGILLCLSSCAGGSPSSALVVARSAEIDAARTKSALNRWRERWQTARTNLANNWENIRIATTVLRKWWMSDGQVERMLKVLMYVSRMDPDGEPILIGMGTLRAASKDHFVVDRLVSYSASRLGWDLNRASYGDDTTGMFIEFSVNGIFPKFVDEHKLSQMGSSKSEENEGIRETEDAALLLDQIAFTVRQNEAKPLHHLFESVLFRMSHLGNGKMRARVHKWTAEWTDIKQKMREHNVREELMDFSAWLFSAMHFEQLLEVVLYFTNVSQVLEIPRAALHMFGIEGLLTKAMHALSKKMQNTKNAFVRVAGTFLFEENGFVPLFLRKGRPIHHHVHGNDAQIEEELEGTRGVMRLNEEETVRLVKEVTKTVVEHKGKSRENIVDKAVKKLSKWRRRFKFVGKIKAGWKKLKRIELASVKQEFKNLGSRLAGLISADRAYELLSYLFGIVKLDGPITLASTALQIFGLEEKVFEWLDDKAVKFLQSNVLKSHKGLKNFLVKFMIGECRLKKPQSAISGGAKAKRSKRETGERKPTLREVMAQRDSWEEEVPNEVGETDEEKADMVAVGDSKTDEEEAEMATVQEEREMEKTPVLVLYKGCQDQHYGVLKQIIHGGDNFEWDLMDDLREGKRKLGTLIATLQGNLQSDLDHLVHLHRVNDPKHFASARQGQQAEPRGQQDDVWKHQGGYAQTISVYQPNLAAHLVQTAQRFNAKQPEVNGNPNMSGSGAAGVLQPVQKYLSNAKREMAHIRSEEVEKRRRTTDFNERHKKWQRARVLVQQKLREERREQAAKDGQGVENGETANIAKVVEELVEKKSGKERNEDKHTL